VLDQRGLLMPLYFMALLWGYFIEAMATGRKRQQREKD
jgi:hypothetical protein